MTATILAHLTFWLTPFTVAGFASAFSFWRAARTGARVEATLPAWIAGGMLWCFAAGSFGFLRIGMMLWLAAAAFCCVLAWREVKKRGTAPLRRGLNAPLYFAFLLWIATAFAVNLPRELWLWDEFSHWGHAARLLWEHGRFSCCFADVMSHPSYPPGTALWLYAVDFLAGGYRESTALFGMDVLYGVFFLAPFAAMPRLGWRAGCVAAAFFLLTPWFFFPNIRSLYVDGLLGLLFGGGAFLIFEWKRDTGVLFALLCALLPLIKSTGTAFAILLEVLLLAWLARSPRAFFPQGERLKRLLLLAVVLAAPFLVRAGWKFQLARSGCPEVFSGAHIRFHVLAALFDGQPPYAATVAMRFGAALLPTALPVLAVTLAVFLLLRKRTRDSDERAALTTAAWGFGIAAAAYWCGILIYYLFEFSPDQALKLVSFDRYVNTFLLAPVLCGGFFLFRHRDIFPSGRGWTAGTLLLAAGGAATLWPQYRQYGIAPIWKREMVALAADPHWTPGTRLMIVDRESSGMKGFMLQYLRPFDFRYGDWPPDETDAPAPEQPIRWLYLSDLPPGFAARHADRFLGGKSVVRAKSLYAVSPDGRLKWVSSEKIGEENRGSGIDLSPKHAIVPKE